jgi:DNA polymerase-3 subunit delta
MWERHGARVVCQLPRKSPRSKQIDFDFERWLTTRARVDFGKRLTPAAAAALAESGAELQPLYGELEKVALYVGNSDEIDRPDVEAVCLRGTMGTVWEWCDAVGARDTDRALELLGHLMEAGESAYRLLPLLATHFCRLGIVLGLEERDPQSIMKALPGRSWYAMARELADQSRHHTQASVARALDRLGKADRMLKSTGHREEFVMQKHLIEVLDDA